MNSNKIDNPVVHGWDEIIAILFSDGIMRFGQKALEYLIITQEYKQLLSRAEFRILGRLDFGEKWSIYAKEAPTLFKLDSTCKIEVRQPSAIISYG